MYRWIGRTALVTGAADGIGIALCRSLVKEGMIVLGCDKNIDKVKELMVELHKYPKKLHAWRCDMSIESDILAMYDYIRTSLGCFAVSINNGTCCIDSPLLTGNSNEWRQMLKVGVEGTSISAREAIRLMDEKFVDDGIIIQIGSVIGAKDTYNQIDRIRNDPNKFYNFYSGLTTMNRALAEGLRRELRAKKSGIRVTTLNIGSVEDEIYTRAVYDENECHARDLRLYGHLLPSSVADVVNHILQQPLRVNVNEIRLGPQQTII